ncbi:MAG: hypothetical protein CM1200mP27_13500 [Chloroflexota bacterium]|nr:MAG: hypothetical protein CM1200mP27_13500 [Chloroflexota bacterium]
MSSKDLCESLYSLDSFFGMEYCNIAYILKPYGRSDSAKFGGHYAVSHFITSHT